MQHSLQALSATALTMQQKEKYLTTPQNKNCHTLSRKEMAGAIIAKQGGLRQTHFKGSQQQKCTHAGVQQNSEAVRYCMTDACPLASNTCSTATQGNVAAGGTQKQQVIRVEQQSFYMSNHSQVGVAICLYSSQGRCSGKATVDVHTTTCSRLGRTALPPLSPKVDNNKSSAKLGRNRRKLDRPPYARPSADIPQQAACAHS